MYRGHTVCVVVPAHNEAGFVGDVLRSVPAYADRIVVVDDASTDGTWQEVLGAADAVADDDGGSPGAANAGAGAGTVAAEPADDDRAGGDRAAGDRTGDGHAGGDRVGDGESPAADGGGSGSDHAVGRGVDGALADRVSASHRRGRLHALRHDQNVGAGGAIKTGYLAAVADDVDVVATIDGDGQMDPGELSAILDPVVAGDVGYAKGNRLLHREYRAEIPPLRLLGNAALTGLTKVASGYWTLVDPQNGFTAISSGALAAVDVGDLYEDYGYLNDLLIRLNVADVPIADVPVSVQYSEERSDIQYSSYVLNVSRLLLTGFLWRLKRSYVLRDVHPLVLFYLSGAAMTLLGLLGGLAALWGRARGDEDDCGRGVLAGMLAVAGYVCLLFGMALDRWENRGLGAHYEPDDERTGGER